MVGALLAAAVVVALLPLFVILKSFHRIGPAEVGLVNKRVAFRRLSDDNPIAFRGEAGYQARLLMPGLRFKLWPFFGVSKYPWPQVPAGEIGWSSPRSAPPCRSGPRPLATAASSATSPISTCS